jgi:hypothetical protein
MGAIDFSEIFSGHSEMGAHCFLAVSSDRFENQDVIVF